LTLDDLEGHSGTNYRVVQQKRHKVCGTIISQPYITVMRFSAKCSERNSLHDLSQCLNTAIKYSLYLPLANELLKNSITFNVFWSIKHATIIL